MRKVTYPDIECDDPFSTCLSSVNKNTPENVKYVDRMNAVSGEVYSEWNVFDSRIATKSLHLFKACLRAHPEQPILEGVTKQDFKELYETYMIKKKTESRKIYDKLILSAETCPLCGLKDPFTLDHYMPKARYPIHSVNPKNLIPACRDCNTVKSDGIFKERHDQTLYPYDEVEHFYNTDWVFSSISRPNGVLTFDFYADPPLNWPRGDRERAINHFKGFNIREAYSKDAARSIRSLMTNINYILKDGGDGRKVKSFYLAHASANPYNSRKRAMALAIIANKALCNGRF